MILRLDHVAFAVWDMRAAASLWHTALGGEYRQGGTEYRGFKFLQFAWPQGGRGEDYGDPRWMEAFVSVLEVASR